MKRRQAMLIFHAIIKKYYRTKVRRMATSSFDKKFVIKDAKIAERFLQSLQEQKKIKVIQCNVEAETKKGLELLKRSFSA
jgi:hypothetical protein